MKRFLIPVMFILLFISSLPVYALKLKIDPDLIDPGKEPYQFDVVIEDAVEYLGAFQFDLFYDLTVITVNDVQFGSFLPDSGFMEFEDIQNAKGKLSYAAYNSSTSEGPSGEGILATVTYTPSNPDAVCEVKFDVHRTWILATGNNDPLQRDLEPGHVGPTCDIIVTPPTNGTLTPSGEGGLVTVKKGENQTFLIAPENDCHEISDVVINDESKGALSAYTFENVTCDSGETHSIAAVFASKQFTVTPSVSGEGGSISPDGPVAVDCGSDVTFTISPETDQCYLIADVLTDTVSVGAASSHTFENVTTDHSITARFGTNTCTITPSADPGGTISPSVPVTLDCAPQQFDITPDDGWSIEDVVVNDVSQGPVSSYTFDTCGAGGQTIHAKFIQDYFTINVCQNDNGRIHLAVQGQPSGEVRVLRGSEPLFEIVPDACHEMSDLLVVPVVIVCSEISEGQSVMQDVELNPNGIGYYRFPPVESDFTIKPVFAVKKQTIGASAGDGGNISPSGSLEVDCGSDQTFTITPGDCYQIANVTVDGNTIESVIKEDSGTGSYEFVNVTGNHAIRATFEKIPYTITATAGKNGIIDPSGEVTLLCGEEQKFTITPNEGFPVQEVIINGGVITCGEVEACEEVEGKIEYTFNVRENGHTIHARFEGDDTITALVAGREGEIDPPAGEVPMAEGGNQTFTITPGSLALLYVLVDGESVGAVAEYTFEMVREGHTIIAVFEEVTVTANAEANGEIEPSGEAKVPFGQNQTFTITPDSCHQIADVRIGEGDSAVSVMEAVEIDASSGVGTYKFKEVTEPDTLSVTFEPVSPYTLTVAAGDGGSISPSGSVKAECDPFTITPDPCHQIADVKIGEGESAASVMEDVVINESGIGDYELKDVTQSDSLSVTFERISDISDVNGDGSVDLRDAILALKILSGVNSLNLEDADANDDALIGIEDAVFLLGDDTVGTDDLMNTILIMELLTGGNVITEAITLCSDVNGDGRIGMEEVLHILLDITDSKL